MRTRKTLAAAALLGLVVLFNLGCEDSDVLAPADATLSLSANPGTVVIDIEAGEDSGTTILTARLFDATNFPLQNVPVEFSSSAGVLSSASLPEPPETDANGVVRDTLTVELGDDLDIDITAQSGSLVATVTVTVDPDTGNDQPTAEIDVDPPDGGQIGQSIFFDGRDSEDTDGSITCYKWTIDSSNNAEDKIEQGTTLSTIDESFPGDRVINVTLQVSDDPTIASVCNRTSPEVDDAFFSPNSASINGYVISCDPTPPTADAGANRNTTLIGGTATVALDGTGSEDPTPASPPLTYSWTGCGPGSTGLDTAAPTCIFTSAGTFTVSLTVSNSCGQLSVDTTTVTVNVGT